MRSTFTTASQGWAVAQPAGLNPDNSTHNSMHWLGDSRPPLMQISNLLAKVMTAAKRPAAKPEGISYQVEWQALSVSSSTATQQHRKMWQLSHADAPPVPVQGQRQLISRRREVSLQSAAGSAKGHLRQLQGLLAGAQRGGKLSLVTRGGRGADLGCPGRQPSPLSASSAWALLKVGVSHRSF